MKHFILIDPTADDLPMPGVDGAILKHIVEYMNHCGGVEAPIIPKPLRSKEMAKVTNEWDAAFIDRLGVDRQPLYDIILVSNFCCLFTLIYFVYLYVRLQTTWISKAFFTWAAPKSLPSSKV